MVKGFEPCPYCGGFGVCAIDLRKPFNNKIYRFKKDPEAEWVWLVCRPCYGRGCDPSSRIEDWAIPPFKRTWQFAHDEFELLHIAAQVRFLAPAHPKDILNSKEEQEYRMTTRLNEIRDQRMRLLRYRLRVARKNGNLDV